MDEATSRHNVGNAKQTESFDRCSQCIIHSSVNANNAISRRVRWDEFTNKHAHCVEDISSDRCRSRPVRMGISKKNSVWKAPVSRQGRGEVRKIILTSSIRSGSRSSGYPNLQFTVSILIALNPEDVNNRQIYWTRRHLWRPVVMMRPKQREPDSATTNTSKLVSQYFMQAKTFTHVGADIAGKLYCHKLSRVYIYPNTYLNTETCNGVRRLFSSTSAGHF